MTIVLDEHETAKQAIIDRTLGKHPVETLVRVGRYYIDTTEGATKEDIRSLLESFLVECNPSASLSIWTNRIDYAIGYAFKHKAVRIDSLPVTQPELNTIDGIEHSQAQRLAFTLLCLAKYWDMVNPKNHHWTNYEDNKIMALANIKTSVRRQTALYSELKKAGLIQLAKRVDSTNARVLFVQDGETVLSITDMRNLGYQYLQYCGEPFFNCENCGAVTKINNPSRGRRQKYCRDCAAFISAQQRLSGMF